MQLENELNVARNLAQKAGSMALELRDKLTIAHKPNGQGPVTNADIVIDRFIVQNLASQFPKDRIISEETYCEKSGPVNGGRTWFIDPIDGTASYILGNDDFVIMIGLAIDGIARLGVIFQPTHNKLWWGRYFDKNPMAMVIYKNQSTLLNLQETAMPSSLTLIGSRTHKSRRQEMMIKQLKPKQLILCSSVGLKAMMIIEKNADIYVAWSHRVKMWDTCAPCAVINAAYGHISLTDGQKLNFMGPICHPGPILIANFKPDLPLFNILNKITEST